MTPDDGALDAAAFALFAAQAADLDVVEAGARMEWERDAELRTFWHRQVQVVVQSLQESAASRRGAVAMPTEPARIMDVASPPVCSSPSCTAGPAYHCPECGKHHVVPSLVPGCKHNGRSRP